MYLYLLIPSHSMVTECFKILINYKLKICFHYEISIAISLNFIINSNRLYENFWIFVLKKWVCFVTAHFHRDVHLLRDVHLNAMSFVCFWLHVLFLYILLTMSKFSNCCWDGFAASFTFVKDAPFIHFDCHWKSKLVN